MDDVKKIFAKLTNFINWMMSILAVLCWAMLVIIVAGVAYWLMARMFGWPVGFVKVTGTELMGIGVFLFCAAFAIKGR